MKSFPAQKTVSQSLWAIYLIFKSPRRYFTLKGRTGHFEITCKQTCNLAREPAALLLRDGFASRKDEPKKRLQPRFHHSGTSHKQTCQVAQRTTRFSSQLTNIESCSSSVAVCIQLCLSPYIWRQEALVWRHRDLQAPARWEHLWSRAALVLLALEEGRVCAEKLWLQWPCPQFGGIKKQPVCAGCKANPPDPYFLQLVVLSGPGWNIC